MSAPSMRRSDGRGAPARRRMVGKMSYVVTTSLLTRPASIVPGHETSPGSRTPPSHVVCFPSRSRPAEPPARPRTSHGPLSEVKKVRVVLRTPARVTASMMPPTAVSSSRSASPNRPRSVVLQYGRDAKSGVWTWLKAMYSSHGCRAADRPPRNARAASTYRPVSRLRSAGCSRMRSLPEGHGPCEWTSGSGGRELWSSQAEEPMSTE
mmetsp:Transcript_21560/g.71301  ORF Transcript_21560/g.71301 Transcript_21560/m.71301 type:complete len:208 (-) Transcript_21560:462-1085(-)